MSLYYAPSPICTVWLLGVPFWEFPDTKIPVKEAHLNEGCRSISWPDIYPNICHTHQDWPAALAVIWTTLFSGSCRNQHITESAFLKTANGEQDKWMGGYYRAPSGLRMWWTFNRGVSVLAFAIFLVGKGAAMVPFLTLKGIICHTHLNNKVVAVLARVMG